MVKIIDNPSPANIKMYTAKTAGIRKNGAPLNQLSSGATDEDSVKLSATAREIRDALNILHNTPDIREEKVASIKLRIQSGTYAINPDIIADNMISEAFLNEGLSP